MICERREEDRSQGGDAKCAGELLHGLERAGRRADFIHTYSGQDEIEQLAHARAGAEPDEEESGGKVHRRGQREAAHGERQDDGAGTLKTSGGSQPMSQESSVSA